MNKLEARYAAYLTEEQRQGRIDWFAFEAIKLKLADKTYLTPDFLVMDSSGLLECHEAKGFWEDDARVKIKCAAVKFPFRFLAVQWRGGCWVFEEI